MQSSVQSQIESHQISEALLNVMTGDADNDTLILAEAARVSEPVRFQSQFIDSMEMSADAGTVAQYLDEHQNWFRRCAHPMKAEPLGCYGYALVIGRYGSFGYEVEPKIGLNLLPQEQGVYRIETIPIPGYTAPGYDVDFKATMELVEVASADAQAGTPTVTRVEWQLDLMVTIQFPRFIYALPLSVIQSTGDHLLRQVVRQVSRRLTYKVLQDFHNSHGLPMPKGQKRKWFTA
ncbi:hypothetical protein BST81_16470 [Leptolyngbya sp. 'hensonii']|uniref:DUF1997 domain-containing protein n=1 Tax=Leptolyngbya sp. 'hensonii' TaxID=1922337 RepID=UPI00094F52B8|nr:DUF1997 domain-containing protein [Leptolyngbya sp. 'hensonii']OLP17391.1 hypothetical protein BST81_16470 [Leptolyngbya sp. 'hensonii']